MKFEHFQLLNKNCNITRNTNKYKSEEGMTVLMSLLTGNFFLDDLTLFQILWFILENEENIKIFFELLFNSCQKKIIIIIPENLSEQVVEKCVVFHIKNNIYWEKMTLGRKYKQCMFQSNEGIPCYKICHPSKNYCDQHTCPMATYLGICDHGTESCGQECNVHHVLTSWFLRNSR